MGRIAVYILISIITGIAMMRITCRYYTCRFDKPLKAGIVEALYVDGPCGIRRICRCVWI